MFLLRISFWKHWFIIIHHKFIWSHIIYISRPTLTLFLEKMIFQLLEMSSTASQVVLLSSFHYCLLWHWWPTDISCHSLLCGFASRIHARICWSSGRHLWPASHWTTFSWQGTYWPILDHDIAIDSHLFHNNYPFSVFVAVC